MVKCFVFDFDGTLVQSNEIKRNAFFCVVQKFGNFNFIVDATLREDAADDRYAILNKIAKKIVKTVKSDKELTWDILASSLLEDYSRVCEEKLAKCEEVVGASDLLKSLSEEGFPLYINSATPLEPLKKILCSRSFYKYISGVYGKPKDKVENMKEIMNETGTKPGELIFIGDNDTDKKAAEAIGCHFIGIIGHDNNYLYKPKYSVENLMEAKLLIDKIKR